MPSNDAPPGCVVPSGPIELARPLRHPQQLPIIGHAAPQFGITLELN